MCLEKHRAAWGEGPMQKGVPLPLNKGQWDWFGEMKWWCFLVAVSVIWFVGRRRKGWPSLTRLWAYVYIRLCVSACGCTNEYEEDAGGLVYSIRGLEQCGWTRPAMILLKRNRKRQAFSVSNGGLIWASRNQAIQGTELANGGVLIILSGWRSEAACERVCMCVSSFYCGNPLLTGLK